MTEKAHVSRLDRKALELITFATVVWFVSFLISPALVVIGSPETVGGIVAMCAVILGTTFVGLLLFFITASAVKNFFLRCCYCLLFPAFFGGLLLAAAEVVSGWPRSGLSAFTSNFASGALCFYLGTIPAWLFSIPLTLKLFYDYEAQLIAQFRSPSSSRG